MQNPLKLFPSDDPIERVHAFARDLAYGAINGAWDTIIIADQYGNWSHNPETIIKGKDSYTSEEAEFSSKWDYECPSLSLLLSFEYIEKVGERGQKMRVEGYVVDEFTPPRFEIEYVITPKAFALLEKPTTAPKIFISYKRDESSALGLLIESRLKMVDSGIGIFIDKELEPGDKWHGKLEREVRQRPFFICLLGPRSLGSKFVRNEIEWALDEVDKSDKVIIPICHNRYHFNAELHEELERDVSIINPLVEKLSIHNAIIVSPESAEQYELAMIKLLNRLGYSNI